MKRSAYGVAVSGAALAGMLLLAGCGDGGRDGADAGTSESAPSASTSRTVGSTDPSASTPAPAPTSSSPAPTSPAPTPPPAPADERLVTVTVSGGIDGRHQSMLINGDGSYTTLSLRPERPERKGRMKPAELAELRTALAEADFAKLPRLNIPEQPVPDGLTTAVVYRGHEVVTGDGAKPLPRLDRVIAALPPMGAGT
ncbi:hypothetical protein ABCR94_09970 [Streptomyces sp. 21So2-11]|uniref:hypothetical protein n=1 Tax=Streptomyces sp. 21So2-11 TaxID=3144408 RepID=UPI00321B1A16